MTARLIQVGPHNETVIAQAVCVKDSQPRAPRVARPSLGGVCAMV